METIHSKKNRNLVGLALAFLLNFIFTVSFHTFGVIPPFLSELGASKSYIGLFMNTNALALVLYVLFFGHLVNRINKKSFLTAGFALMLFTMVGMYFFHTNLAALAFLKILSSISFAFGFTMIFTIAHALVPDDKRTAFIALFGISGLSASPVGSLISEGISDNIGPQYLYLATAVIAVLAIIFSRLLYDPTEIKPGDKLGRKISLKEFFSQKEFYPLILLTFIFGGIFATFTTFIPNFSKEQLGETNISNFFISFSITAVVIRLVFFRVFDKLPRKVLFIIAFSAGLCGMVMIQFLNFKWMLLCIGFFYGICHSLLFPTLSAEFVQKAKSDAKAQATNIFLAFNFFGPLSLSVLLGFLGDMFGTPIIFQVMTGVILLALITVIKVIRN